MSDASGASGPELAVLDDLVVAGFPIDAKPYCVIAGRLGMLEGDVLETAHRCDVRPRGLRGPLRR